jgi:UDP-glucose 4-epimerase
MPNRSKSSDSRKLAVVGITGAGGMVGRHLVDALRASRVKIRALLLPNEAVPPSFQDVEIFRGDVRNRSDLSPFLRGADTVFHLASLVGRDANRKPLDQVRQVNVMGTRNVMEQAKLHQVGRFVFLSTCCVYGLHGIADELIDEDAARTPRDLPYDLTKAEAEASVMAEERGTLEWSILQIPVALGGEHTLDKPTILSLTKLLVLGLVPRPFGGINWVNYVFGRDAAEALIALAQHPAAVGQAFIYSESAPLSLFLSWMGRELGRKTWTVPVPALAFDLGARATQFGLVLANQRRFSARKIESLLGFRPSVGLQEGLARTLRHYRDAGLIKGQA